jgi:hypothetical protein
LGEIERSRGFEQAATYRDRVDNPEMLQAQPLVQMSFRGHLLVPS